MSERLLKKLGMGPKDLQPLSFSKIQTAKMGASLEIMGELKQRIYLQLGGCETRFRCRPVVVRGLTHDLNLSGPFLRQNKIGQIHSRDAIKINGHEVPLLTARGRPAVPRAEVLSAPAYFAKKTILAPNSITMCSLRVMNPLDQPVTIQSGQQYSQVTLTCDVNEAHSFQALLPTIRPRSSPTSTPTTLTDATLRALSVNSISGNSATDRQMAPQSRDRPRNNLGHHLTATREEPEAPSSGSRMDRSNLQGEPPTRTES
jgi:hypothetical protein